MSEREAAGRLISMPGIVDAAAITPMRLGGVSKLIAKGLRTGFLDIVELRMAIVPIMQSIIKKTLFARYILFKFTF
jgi:hypothetical protein